MMKRCQDCKYPFWSYSDNTGNKVLICELIEEGEPKRIRLCYLIKQMSVLIILV